MRLKYNTSQLMNRNINIKWRERHPINGMVSKAILAYFSNFKYFTHSYNKSIKTYCDNADSSDM